MPSGKSKTKPSKNASGDFIPVRQKDVLSRRNQDGTIAIMKLDNDHFFFTLDGIAAELWGEINGKTSLKKLIEIVISKYGPTPSQAQKDVSKLIADLKKEKLIQG